MYVDQERLHKWVKASFKAVLLVPKENNEVFNFMAPAIQKLGRLDIKLLTAESDYLLRLNQSLSEMIGELDELETLSYLWVLGAYEIIRTLSGFTKGNNINKVKQSFTRLRIPLAKMEPSRKHKSTDYPIAYPTIHPNYGIAWQVSTDTIISRKDLSDLFLDFLLKPDEP